MPTVTILPGSGNIEVLGSPEPLYQDYTVKFGVVLLTQELADQAKEFGWERVGTKEDFVVVGRDEATWAKYDAVSHVR